MTRLLAWIIAVTGIVACHAQVSHDFGGAYAVVQTGTLRGAFQDAEMVMPVPVNQPMQTIEGLEITPEGARVYTNSEGTIAAAILKTSGSARLNEMQIRYTVRCHPTSFDIQTLASRQYPPYDEDSELFRKYTAADATVQSDHPAIAGIGEKLAADYPNPFARARAAYHYVIQRCDYQVSRAPSALEMLQSGTGNCTGYAKLFIALCRAAGVPARRCSGAVAGQEPPYHLWAEFYLPEVGWVPSDPTNGDAVGDNPEQFLGSLSARPYVLFARGRDFELRHGELTRHIDDMSAGSARWVGDARMEFTFEATRVSPVRYAILFQQSTESRSVSVDLTEAQLSEEIARAAQEGRHCIGVAMASRPDGVRYGAVWERSGSPENWALYPRVSSATLAQLLQSERARRRIPISLASCALDDGGDAYAAVFGPDQGASWSANIGASRDQFMDYVRAEGQNRRVLGTVTAHVLNGAPVVSGVFVQLSLKPSISTGMWMQPEHLDERLQEYAAKGFFPITLGVTDNQPPYFHMVALNTGTPIRWAVQRDLFGEQVPDAVKRASRQKMQPASIVAY